MRVCSRIHVLDYGKLIASGTPSEIQNDPAVIAAYIGTEEVA
jgi:branched-chain amino acid transport system ATP-binding protein